MLVCSLKVIGNIPTAWVNLPTAWISLQKALAPSLNIRVHTPEAIAASLVVLVAVPGLLARFLAMPVPVWKASEDAFTVSVDGQWLLGKTPGASMGC